MTPKSTGPPANAEIDDGAPLPAKLRFAIAHRRLVGLEYNARLRIAEPHDYGAMNGAGKLLVYQLHADGRDESRPSTGWRLLDIAKIGMCKVLEQEFAGSRGDAHERHMQWDAIFARVE